MRSKRAVESPVAPGSVILKKKTSRAFGRAASRKGLLFSSRQSMPPMVSRPAGTASSNHPYPQPRSRMSRMPLSQGMASRTTRLMSFLFSEWCWIMVPTSACTARSE